MVRRRGTPARRRSGQAIAARNNPQPGKTSLSFFFIGAVVVLLTVSFLLFPAASVIATLIILITLAVICLAVVAAFWLPLESALSKYASDSPKRSPVVIYVLLIAILTCWGGYYVGANPEEAAGLVDTAVRFTLRVNNSIETMISEVFYGDVYLPTEEDPLIFEELAPFPVEE